MALTTFGELLNQRGWGYARFMREAQPVARALRLTFVLERRQFDRWRTGKVKGQPRDEACQVLERLFPGRTAQELLTPGDAAGGPLLQAARGTTHVLEDEVNRRSLLGLIGAAAASPAAVEFMRDTRRRMDAALEGTTISEATLDRWEETARDYARAYQALPPQDLLADLLADFAEVGRLLEERQPIRQRRRLCRVAAQLAALAGIFASALGEHREARGFFHTGRLAASESGDQQLEGTLAVRSAIVSLYYGTPATAYAEASRARRSLGTVIGPASTRALVVEARALARMGRVGEALPLLRQAEDMFGHLTAEDREDVALGYTERQFLFHLGNAWTHLRRPEEAFPAQSRALSSYAPGEYLDPALIRIDRATCLAQSGEPEEAYRVAGDALLRLPAEHRTGMVMRYSQDFRMTAGHTEMPAGRQFAELLRS
ncbi:hypothetical protein OG711_27355 [Streptomyces uncialis]|uniref:hypothetical protein n=1 Tax=Streptomyces uncialis TaxID=1048205 RepID=UPI002E3652BA|nr:hypothetical protein [Streptomyces uncialis]